MGKSYEQNDLLLVRISNSDGVCSDNTLQHIQEHPAEFESDPQVHCRSDKPVIYINCGIHAREWVSISTCLWMINEVALLIVFFKMYNKEFLLEYRIET